MADVGAVLGNVILGGSNKRVYTPQEQAIISREFPHLVWRNGVPYTQGAKPDVDPNDPYGYQQQGQQRGTQDADPNGPLVEADLSDPNFALQLARFVAVTSAANAAAGLASGGAAGGVAGGAAPAAGGTAAGGAAGGAAAATGGAAAGGAAGGTAAAAGGSGILAAVDKYGKLAQNLSPVFGGMAGGSADADREAAIAQAARENNISSRFNTAQDAQTNVGRLDLDRQKFDEDSTAARLKRALVAHMMGTTQDVSVSVPGVTPAKISGGLTPSSVRSAGGADLLSFIQQLNLDKAKAGNTYKGGEILATPELEAPARTGGNSFLNYLSGLTSTYGAARTALQGRGATAPPPMPSNGATNLPGMQYGAKLTRPFTLDPTLAGFNDLPQ